MNGEPTADTERNLLGLLSVLQFTADHDLTPDPVSGLLRYEPVQVVSDEVKERWFAWRQGGRLHDVLRSAIPERELCGTDGYAMCEATLCVLDEEFERLLGGHDATPLWTCIRNISPLYWAPEAWDAHAHSRRIAELAIERHGRWTDTTEPLPVEWSPSVTRVAGRCMATAEAYHNLLSARRRIAKGQTGRVADWSPLRMEFTDDSDLDRLIYIRDQRVQADDNPLSSLASHGDPVRHPRFTRRPKRVTASFADPKQLHPDLDARALTSEATTSYGLSVATADIVTDWADTLGSAELATWFAPYDDDLRRDLGYTMADLVAVHALITQVAFPRYDPDRWIPSTLEFCGYVGVNADSVDLSKAQSAARKIGLSNWDAVTENSARSAFRSLLKRPVDTNIRSLGRYPIADLGSTLLVDFVGFNLEYHLVNHLAAAEYFTNSNPFDFEPRVHAALASHGSQPIGAGRNLQINGQRLTDIDSSLVIGNTLIAVDCYASPWRDDLDEGTFETTRNRITALTGKLWRWDRKMSALAESPPQWLRDAGVGRILPVVVSATAEWINSSDPRLWFTDELPRICTTKELIEQVLPDVDRWTAHLIEL